MTSKTIARIPLIYNTALTTAGVEQSLVLESDYQNSSIKRIQIKSRTSNDLKYSYLAGGNYVTIFAGQTYWQDEIDAWVLTVYLIGTLDGQIAEIEVWT